MSTKRKKAQTTRAASAMGLRTTGPVAARQTQPKSIRKKPGNGTIITQWNISNNQTVIFHFLRSRTRRMMQCSAGV